MLICLLSASAGYLYSYYTYTPAYTSETTFVVSNKTVGVENESESMTLSDFNASTALANTFKYILLSDEAMYAIINTYGLDMSISNLKDCVSISPVSNTNVLEMAVTTQDAVLSWDISNQIIEYYPDVLERTIKYASLEVLNPPLVAPSVDGYRGNIIYPFFGFSIAFFISLIFIYLKQVFHNTIRTVSDISKKLGMNTLASIPKVKASKKKDLKGLYITDKSNGFIFTESYKALRTKIEMIAEKKGYKTFVVTSALENEGKTTVAVNLSIALAENNKKVLLIDADLRKPSIYKFMGLPEFDNEQVLYGDTISESTIVNIEKFGFSALMNVNEFTNSSELLSSTQMKKLINNVSEQYDFVIIDSSPASVLTDSAVITTYTDAIILTMRQDYASIRLVESVVQGLSENRAEFIGCIFNIVDERGFEHEKYWNYDKYERYGKLIEKKGRQSAAGIIQRWRGSDQPK